MGRAPDRSAAPRRQRVTRTKSAAHVASSASDRAVLGAIASDRRFDQLEYDGCISASRAEARLLREQGGRMLASRIRHAMKESRNDLLFCRSSSYDGVAGQHQRVPRVSARAETGPHCADQLTALGPARAFASAATRCWAPAITTRRTDAYGAEFLLIAFCRRGRSMRNTSSCAR